MGRGLAAILPEVAVDKTGAIKAADTGAAAVAGLLEVEIDRIIPNADQPRKRFDDDSLAGLAQSIKAAGVIQPLLVRPLEGGNYELIAGERRWRASRVAGLERLPVLVRDEDEAARMQTALIENVAREQLNPVDEARACHMLLEDLGLTKKDLGDRLGRSRVAISNLVRLLDLPDETLDLLASGDLSEGHGRALLRAPDHDDRRRLAQQAADEGWSVRETERRAAAAAEPTTPKRLHKPDADEMAALANAADRLEKALGTGVVVKSSPKGIRAELHFEDFDELEAFLRTKRSR